MLQPATTSQDAHLPQLTLTRNPGMDLDMNWVRSVQANTSAIERRAATLPARRSVKRTIRRHGCSRL